MSHYTDESAHHAEHFDTCDLPRCRWCGDEFTPEEPTTVEYPICSWACQWAQDNDHAAHQDAECEREGEALDA